MFNWKEEETHTREKNGKRYVSIVCLVVYLELWVHSIRFDRWLFHTHTFAQLHITFVTFSFEKVCTFSFRWHLFSFRLFHTQKKNQLKKKQKRKLKSLQNRFSAECGACWFAHMFDKNSTILCLNSVISPTNQILRD